MVTASEAGGRGPDHGAGGHGTPAQLIPGAQRRRVFPGHMRELSQVRRWLSSLLAECPVLDDLLSVATELCSNALQHTASGRPGGWFAVEVTSRRSGVQLAVADCGGPTEPRVIDDLEGERGRGLLLVQGLSERTGWSGDSRGRLVWAVVTWGDSVTAAGPSDEACQAAICDVAAPAACTAGGR